MRKVLFVICIMLCSLSVHSQYNSNNSLLQFEPVNKVLENGTYNATVYYKNERTNHQAEYSLTVEVRNDRVVQINFGNGGYINHQSYNINSYTGGSLKFETDYYGNINRAYTTVVVVESNFTRSVFTIYLE